MNKLEPFLETFLCDCGFVLSILPFNRHTNIDKGAQHGARRFGMTAQRQEVAPSVLGGGINHPDLESIPNPLLVCTKEQHLTPCILTDTDNQIAACPH